MRRVLLSESVGAAALGSGALLGAWESNAGLYLLAIVSGLMATYSP